MELMDNIYLDSNWGLTEGVEEHAKRKRRKKIRFKKRDKRIGL